MTKDYSKFLEITYKIEDILSNPNLNLFHSPTFNKSISKQQIRN